MFVRLTFINFLPAQQQNAKRIYNEEIVPIVRAQKGNIGIWLLEPTNNADDYISLTEWTTRENADLYESSGTYKELVTRLKSMYSIKPLLKTYNVEESKVATSL